MAETKKVLGQLDAAATTDETLYTVPASTETVVSTIIVCNRGSADTTFRLLIAVAGAATDNKQYIYYDTSIPGNESFAATLGITLSATDEIHTYAGNGNLSFNAFGVEVT